MAAPPAVKHDPAVDKADRGKPPLSIIPREPLEAIARVLAYGDAKYGPGDWRRTYAWSRYLSAALRHVFAFAAGEDNDADTGESHLAHAACCMLFLLWFQKYHPEADDRRKDPR